jgi:tetratricopeptide (TPR) repeat protein
MRKTPKTSSPPAAPSPPPAPAPPTQRRRPGPPPHHGGGGGGLLNSIYQCVDARNYARVLKLTSPPPPPHAPAGGGRRGVDDKDDDDDERGWDVVRALRAHALERTGRRREALALLLEILASGGEGDGGGGTTWRELRGRVASLAAAEAVAAGAPPGAEFGAFDAVGVLDAAARPPIPRRPRPPRAPAAPAAAPARPLPPVTDACALRTICATLRSQGLHGTASDAYQAAATSLAAAPSSPGGIPGAGDDGENRADVLRDGMSAHLGAACDVPPAGRPTPAAAAAAGAAPAVVAVTAHARRGRRASLLRALLPGLGDALALASYRGRMQACSLQLARATSEPLHLLWTSASCLWLRESLSDLVDVLGRARSLLPPPPPAPSSGEEEEEEEEEEDDDDEEEEEDRALRGWFRDVMARHSHPSDADGVSSLLDGLRQKVALLPRLAESLSSRVVVAGPKGRRGASENDWDVYLDALVAGGKRSEALRALRGVRCAPPSNARGEGERGEEEDGGDGDGDDDDDRPPPAGPLPPRIDDESCVSGRVGSMLPYTRRRRAENMARLCRELGLRDEAEGHYRELLKSFPDQWTYWTALVECSCTVVAAGGGDGEGEGGDGIATTTTTDPPPESSVDEGGWQRCASFARDVAGEAASTGGRGGRRQLRGPHLALIELFAVKLRRRRAGAAVDGDETASLLTSLRDEVSRYGDRFGPVASCCYADLRPYLRVVVRAASDAAASPTGERTAIGGRDEVVPDDVSQLLLWAKEMWATNAQSNDGFGEVDRETIVPERAEDPTDASSLRDRRKRLRKYIFAVQVVFGISSEFEDENVAMRLLRTFAPSMSQMVMEWRTSLSSLPGVAPKDGGQKEVLPGDEIILLASQYLMFEGASSADGSFAPSLLRAASLLEEAVDRSPYNPHLKIAAISVYSRLGAAERALAMYQGLGVRQIQLDSCSYLILPLLVRGGLYTSAIKIASSILRLHGSTSKDVKGYAYDSLENGLIFKANEMVTFQREKMRPSLQLLHSKAVLMDAAPLMIPSEIGNDVVGGGARQRGARQPSAVALASEKGFCGSEGDLPRAERLVVDAESHFNAPSIIHAAAQSALIDDFVSSDNRDLTLYYYESLYRTPHLTQREMVVDSLRSGHVHGLMVRAVMAVGSAGAPKKGKIPKPTEERSYRCLSLCHAVSRAREFGREAALDDVDGALWDACCRLCEAIVAVIIGNRRSDESSIDTLAGREAGAALFIDSATQLVQSARTALSSCRSNVESSSYEHSSMMGARVCQLLPDYVVPLYVLHETTARLFALFGWGKRKRLTKIASGALAESALSLQRLISDMLQVMSQYRSFGGRDVSALEEGASGPGFRIEAIRRVVKEAISSREGTKDRVDSFLLQMDDTLNTFNTEHS